MAEYDLSNPDEAMFLVRLLKDENATLREKLRGLEEENKVQIQRARDYAAALQDDLAETTQKLRAAEEALEKAALRNCIRRKGYPDAPTCASPVPGEGLPRDQWCYSCEARAARTALQREKTNDE